MNDVYHVNYLSETIDNQFLEPSFLIKNGDPIGSPH